VDPLIIERLPTLRHPVLILAFSGWNDAGEAATSAAQFLCSRLNAQKFASLDPEEFYNFAELRPRVRLTKGLQREITWPANEFFFVEDPSLVQDLVIGVGIEPHLKWKTYIAAILELARQCGVGMVLTLGALLAEVVYSKPVRITGSSTDPELSARLHLGTSRYEGPTGIVGILNDACRRESLPAVSLWANVPHYLSITRSTCRTWSRRSAILKPRWLRSSPTIRRSLLTCDSSRSEKPTRGTRLPPLGSPNCPAAINWFKSWSNSCGSNVGIGRRSNP
jgi:proteasome assembly chaperone (PAC2) family protein